MLRRRELIVAIGAAVGWPAGRAQAADRLPTIGILCTTTEVIWGSWIAAFKQRLGELGRVEGHTVLIKLREGHGRVESYPDLAGEFVKDSVDVIFTAGGAVLAAERATPTIPIVFVIASDPVGAGMVASLARPGGNATGLSVENADLAGKRMELLKTALPGLKRVLILLNVAYPASVIETAHAEAAARALGIEAQRAELRRTEDVAPAIEAAKGQVQALYICADALLSNSHDEINKLALGAGLGTIAASEYYRSLLAYGPSYAAQFRRGADLVDKILRGTKPADIPVEQPTEFELVVNLKVAKALGVTIPQTLVDRADRVIE